MDARAPARRGRRPRRRLQLLGLEHGLPLAPEELPIANDFVAPALYFERFAAPRSSTSAATRRATTRRCSTA
ncbi:MAG: hypothetical protein R3C15_21635 [Thermoleophilia bacterium]